MKQDYKLYLTYSENHSGGGIRDGQENDSWPDYNDSYIDFTPVEMSTSRKDNMYPHGLLDSEIFGDFEPGDLGHLVINRYSDGDSFSFTSGYWQIAGFFKDGKEAIEVKKSIEEKRYKGNLYIYDGGYFGRPEGVEIHTMLVQ